ncbi:MAG: cupin [Candidatus Omnitrophica bacterium 4484_70.2]|nr:MAG: cupin [Candidatus Omnitrophica bacterium 4484_70.2]
MEVEVKKLSEEELQKLGVKNWPIWEKEESSFDWYYDEEERCYFLEGEVEIELSEGEKVKVGAGDFVSFPKGLKCKWHIKKKVRKHYNFGD